MDIDGRVADHYGHGRVVEDVLAAIAAAGLDPERLRPEDLALVDEFHMRGRSATAELLEAMALDAETHLLDIGCGLGGAARHVVVETGCRVTGVDLVEEYVDAAAALTERCGLSPRIDYRQGSALDLPFDDGSFDALMTQHVAMNIPAKDGMYAEARRVALPDAVFGIYDILAGPGGDVLFPVPWARDGSTSFLVSRDEMLALVQAAGFEVVAVRDRSDECRAWVEGMRGRAASGAPQLGFHLLLGADFPQMAANLARNLLEGRIRPTEIVCRAA